MGTTPSRSRSAIKDSPDKHSIIKNAFSRPIISRSDPFSVLRRVPAGGVLLVFNWTSARDGERIRSSINSNFPPVSALCPKSRAGNTLVSLITSKSPSRNLAPKSSKPASINAPSAGGTISNRLSPRFTGGAWAIRDSGRE